MYRADGVEVRRTEVSYDDVARTRTTTVIDGTLRFTEVRSYDAHGRLTRVAIEPLDAGSHQPPVLEELHYDGDRLVEIVDQSEGWTRRARYRYCD